MSLSRTSIQSPKMFKLTALTGGFGLALAALLSSLVNSQAQLTFNFASTPGATIQFNGTSSTFQFNNSATPLYVGTQWQIGSENGGTGSAIGLFGVVNNSPFSYGPITTILLPGLDYEYANVTGPLGGLSINDGAGGFLTGNVDWIQVATYNYVGAINGQLTVNVTGLSYAGSNPDLLTLAANAPAAMSLSFQFAPGQTLSSLSSGTGPYMTSFSGSLSVVPEPSALPMAMLGLVVCGLATVSRRHARKTAPVRQEITSHRRD